MGDSKDASEATAAVPSDGALSNTATSQPSDVKDGFAEESKEASPQGAACEPSSDPKAVVSASGTRGVPASVSAITTAASAPKDASETSDPAAANSHEDAQAATSVSVEHADEADSTKVLLTEEKSAAGDETVNAPVAEVAAGAAETSASVEDARDSGSSEMVTPPNPPLSLELPPPPSVPQPPINAAVGGQAAGIVSTSA
eukprot:TRINITY_DN19959_c0_g2_i2.p1 TRINITY_DN19959_c0_g2~~TRINITY_DN19959_c0_g2_i2.p1  ORF type:complete len:201 (-),score=40.81 TRINITY_DN19959_c0_g2_i2:99-701(-)